MKEIVADTSLVAFCGLYCAACRTYRKGKCSGCQKNEKATWCKVRTCCLDKKHSSCADCTLHDNPMKCTRFNNFVSRLFGLLFRSDRAACINQIRNLGLDGHARTMAQKGHITLKRRGKQA